MLEKSCGAVVFTRIDGIVHYVILQRHDGTHGFPKGHMDLGESETETAIREIYEETHLKPIILEGFRAVEIYQIPYTENTWKQVVYFLAEYQNQHLISQASEVKRIELLPFHEAMDRLEYAQTKRILCDALAFIKDGNGND